MKRSNGNNEKIKPNIVFIITDQMRGDCMSCAGHPVVETPNLDMLAAHGTLFTASYSSCPSCIAARASIFTGLSPSSHGRLGYRDCIPWNYKFTLPQLLARAGYQTHCVGKTHFYPQGIKLGFESIVSYEGDQNFDGKFINDYHVWLAKQTNNLLSETDHGVDWNSWYARPSHLPEELHNNTWVITKGIEFLKNRDITRPFFLNLSFHRPHAPVDPPKVFYDMYKDRDDIPVPIGDWAHIYDVPVDNINAWYGRVPPSLLRRLRLAYYAQVAHIDNQIGRFIMAIHKLMLYPTWIIFTSDHGEMLGDHFLFRKSYAYEGSAKTPLIICPPHKSMIHECHLPVISQDIMPTILEIAGVSIPQEVEGKSLLPLLSTPHDKCRWRSYVHGEHTTCYAPGNSMQYLTDGKEKYIWHPLTGAEELFDLVSDPLETHNLAKDYKAKAILKKWRKCLIHQLVTRKEDKLSDGKKLLPGKELPQVREFLLKEKDRL